MVDGPARIRMADRCRRHDRRGLPRPDIRLRPLPRSQVRPDHASAITTRCRRSSPPAIGPIPDKVRLEPHQGAQRAAVGRPGPEGAAGRPALHGADRGPGRAFACFTAREPLVVHRLHRGELGKPRRGRRAGLPGGAGARPADVGPGSSAVRPDERRAALARWLTSPENPLVGTGAGEPRLGLALRPGDRRARPTISARRARSRPIPNCSTGWPATSSTTAGASSACTG